MNELGGDSRREALFFPRLLLQSARAVFQIRVEASES
jgi:hypothetical protein